MKLENICCSYELAQRLKHLGVLQDSYFTIGAKGVITETWALGGDEDDDICSAFTLSELGIALPPFFPTYIHDGHKHSHCANARVDTFPLGDCLEDEATTPPYIINKELVPIQTATTEVDSKAIMLVFLLWNSIITVEEVNNRLAQNS